MLDKDYHYLILQFCGSAVGAQTIFRYLTSAQKLTSNKHSLAHDNVNTGYIAYKR